MGVTLKMTDNNFFGDSRNMNRNYELVYTSWYKGRVKNFSKSKKRGLPLDPRYVGTCTIDTEKIETDPKKDIEIPSWQKQVLNKT